MRNPAAGWQDHTSAAEIAFEDDAPVARELCGYGLGADAEHGHGGLPSAGAVDGEGPLAVG
jgi:hypothetical protein